MAKFIFKSLPPVEAIKFFRAKGWAKGFAWQDIWKEEHAVAFTVAKAMKLKILEDIRGAVDQALAEGTTFRDFSKRLTPILQAHGWWGEKIIEGKSVQLGSPRRLRIIYDTNLRMAHAAGRWQRIERVKARRPYLRYMAVLDQRTRPQHHAWHGTVLPVDAAWWSTHYPPNGWRCRCIVQQLSARDLKRYGYKVAIPPKIEERPWLNKRTGKTVSVPEGIDPGFDYNVGQARLRALTPPPRGGLPTSFPPGTDLPPLPRPRQADAGRVLPDNLPDDEYVGRFLDEFGARPGKPVIFTDAVGEDMVIGEDLFLTAAGDLKVSKGKRHVDLLILADTIKSPDEIWWIWEELKSKPGAWTLRRRYIARWQLPDQRAAGISVFEWSSSGWKGKTTFTPAAGKLVDAQDRYLSRQRHGTLAYRRKK